MFYNIYVTFMETMRFHYTYIEMTVNSTVTIGADLRSDD